MPPTKKNHINPCFWTALWNETYFNDFINGRKTQRARDQKVFTLDYRTPKILLKKTEDVHYSENLGLILAEGKELTASDKIFGTDEIYFPESKKTTSLSKIDADGIYLLDAEIDFSSLEEIAGYQHLLNTVKNNKIENEEDRIYLACFIIYHQLRSEKFFHSLFKKYENEDNPKLESFIQFRNTISNVNQIYNAVFPLVNSYWTLYSTKDFKFPLNDVPILYEKELIWVVLSPKHLLEIDKSKIYPGRVKCRSEISIRLFSNLRKTIIKNTVQEIIFHSYKAAHNWRKSKTYYFRKKSLGY